MADKERNHSRIAYHLAKSTSAYLTAVVAVESGKGQGQRMELSDNEVYAANIMLIIAVNKLSIDYQQKPSVVHSLALEDFWNGIYSDAQVKSLQIEMNDKYNGLLVNSSDILESAWWY